MFKGTPARHNVCLMTTPPDELSTVAHARFDPSDAPEASFVVTVADGPDRGQSLLVDGSAPAGALIGTSPSCGLKLSDRSVSRRHVGLEVDRDRLRVTDLHSTNGTFVGEVQVTGALLRGGESLRVGATTLHVQRQQATQTTLPSATAFGLLRGASREMRRLYPLCERLAKSMVPVIIEGETGTGKEVLAESLHLQGPRAQGPFEVFDCTAVSETLVESELFGHEKGAFTGAVGTRKGVFERAHGGTLFIDEIGDLAPSMQPKLLRAIERSEIRRVGGDKWQRVDVRILAATRRNLDDEVEQGRFREDLFHRLAVTRIELPPLRARRGDVPMLVRSFCVDLAAPGAIIAPEVMARWERHDWPGNVRELRNAVARHLAIGDFDALPPTDPSHHTDIIEKVIAAGLPLPRAREQVVELFERRYLDAVLARHGGNVSQAAEASGIARRYFQILRAKLRSS